MSHHKLNHINVVKFHAIVFEPDHYGVVLEYVPKKGLDEFIQQNPVSLWLYM